MMAGDDSLAARSDFSEDDGVLVSQRDFLNHSMCCKSLPISAADLRNGDDLVWHDRLPFGSVLGQGQVRSGAMVVGELSRIGRDGLTRRGNARKIF